MARRKSRTLTELELQIMRIVWQKKEIFVTDLQKLLKKGGKNLAQPSIRTMLGILEEKGYVKRRHLGRGFAYRAAVSEEKAQKNILKDIVNRAFDGSAWGLVAALVRSQMVSKKDIDEIKRLIRERDKEQS